MKRFIRLFLFILAGVFILRIPALYQHIVDIDESVFSEFARVILDGGLPYVDVVDNKPPLTYYFFALVYRLSGSMSLLVVHAVTILWVSITGLLVYIFASRFRGEREGEAAAAVFVLLMHTYEPKYISTNGETLINLLLVASAMIFITVRSCGFRNLLLHILSGVLLGMAVMTNYKAGIMAIVYIIYSLAEPFTIKEERSAALINNMVKLAVTGLASLVPVFGIALYFRSAGNFSEALFWGFTYNFGYIESGSSSSSIKLMARMALFVLLSLPVWVVLFRGTVAVIQSLRKGEQDAAGRPLFLFLFIWLAGSLYAAMLGGRGYGHYFIQLVPPMSVMVVCAPGTLLSRGKAFWIWLVVPVLILTLSRIDIQKSYAIAGDKNAGWKSSYEKTAACLKERTVQGETVYVWGWATPVYYYADRRCASRFVISDFVSGRVFGTANESSQIRDAMKSEYMPLLIADLKKNRPVYFVDTSPSGYFGYDRFPVSLYPELAVYVAENYVKETVIDGITLYRRR